jgi:transcriptional regulator with XRE-family HTH domain
MRTKRAAVDVSPAERIRLYRKDGRLTQPALAEMLGVSKSHLSMIETGRRLPGREVASALEEIAGIPVADWTGVERID